MTWIDKIMEAAATHPEVKTVRITANKLEVMPAYTKLAREIATASGYYAGNASYGVASLQVPLAEQEAAAPEYFAAIHKQNAAEGAHAVFRQMWSNEKKVVMDLATKEWQDSPRAKELKEKEEAAAKDYNEAHSLTLLNVPSWLGGYYQATVKHVDPPAKPEPDSKKVTLTEVLDEAKPTPKKTPLKPLPMLSVTSAMEAATLEELKAATEKFAAAAGTVLETLELN